MLAESSREETIATTGNNNNNFPFSAVKALSLNELRTAVETHLKQSGALKKLKTELRGMMLEGVLKETNKKNVIAAKQHQQAAALAASREKSEPASLENFEQMREFYISANAQTDKFHAREAITASASDLNTTPVQNKSVNEHLEQLHHHEHCTNNKSYEETNVAFQQWCAHVADALVAHHLRITQRPLTYSLFVNEAVVLPLTDCGVREDEDNMLRKMLLFFSQISSLSESSSSSSENLQADSKALRQIRNRNANNYSVLQSLIESVLLLSKEYNTDHTSNSGNNRDKEVNQSVGVQTGNSPQHENNKNNENVISENNMHEPLTTLEARLAAIDVKHALQMSHIQRSQRLLDVEFTNNTQNEDKKLSNDCYRASTTTPLSFQLAVERRLQTYKQEMHTQLRAEYEVKYARFQREKLEEAKEEATRHFALRIENMKEAMSEEKRTLELKLANERQELTLLRERLDAERAQLYKSQSAIADERMHYDEVSALQLEKLRESNEKMMLLQVKCTKWEELASERLIELNQMKRQVKSLTSHIERMYAEFTEETSVKNDEIARLQFRLRMLLNERVEDNTSESWNNEKNDNKHYAHEDHNKDSKHVETKYVNANKTLSHSDTKAVTDTPSKKAIDNNNNTNEIKESNHEANVNMEMCTKQSKSDESQNYNSNILTSIKPRDSKASVDIYRKRRSKEQQEEEEEEEQEEQITTSHSMKRKSAEAELRSTSPNTSSLSSSSSSHTSSVKSNLRANSNSNSNNGNNKSKDDDDDNDVNKSVISNVDSSSSDSSVKPDNITLEKQKEKEQLPEVESSKSATMLASTHNTSTSMKSVKELTTPDHNMNENTTSADIEKQKAIALLNDLVHKDEVEARKTFMEDEQQTWNSITWTAKSQLTLIKEREGAKGNIKNNNDTNNKEDSADYDSEVEVAGSPVSLFERMQRVEVAQQRKNVNNLHSNENVRDDDDTDNFDSDEDEADELLFAKKSASSSSSFEVT